MQAAASTENWHGNHELIQMPNQIAWVHAVVSRGECLLPFLSSQYANVRHDLWYTRGHKGPPLWTPFVSWTKPGRTRRVGEMIVAF